MCSRTLSSIFKDKVPSCVVQILLTLHVVGWTRFYAAEYIVFLRLLDEVTECVFFCTMFWKWIFLLPLFIRLYGFLLCTGD